MSRLMLYPFRFRDQLTGQWVRARHKMQVPEIQRYYGDWQLVGPPEIRNVTQASTTYSPFLSPPAPWVLRP
jgi:hypothetical protein